MQTLPSDPQPARSSGLALAPFRAVRFDPDRVSDLADVTSPPYDVIGPDTVARLLAAEPHNVVRLILPGAGSPQPPRGPAASALAAAQLRDWLGAGVLRPDAQPALYVYEQALPGAAQGWEVIQRGLIGALRLVPPGSPAVLPHEDVMPGPVEGRRELMATTQANLEPIFLLYDGTAAAPEGVPTATALVDRVADGRPPLLTGVTDDGTRHRLWALTDPAEHAVVAADLAARTALIADGHHRYAAYLKLQEQERRAGLGDGPWDYGLAFLVDSAAYPPRIGAIHRVIPGLAPVRAAEMAKDAMQVQPWPGGRGDPAALADAVAALGEAGRHGPAFLLTDGCAQYLLTSPAPERVAEAMPAGHSARWQHLDASVLRELLIRSVWGLADAEPEVHVVHGAPAAAVQAARESGGTAVICNPVAAADVLAVAENGERMPRKSTSFGPKPRTGLVLREWADDR